MRTAVRSITLAIALYPYPLLAQPSNSPDAAVKASTNASQSDADAMQQQIVAKEREGLEALKSGNLELFATLTAEDAVFVDSQGPATKEQVMKNVQNFRLVDFSMQDVKFVSISPTSGLISYKATEKGTSHGREFTAVVYVSSVWTLRQGKWLCQFSQETAAPKTTQQ
jgi:Domain of unknown function (DUF4440)